MSSVVGTMTQLGEPGPGRMQMLPNIALPDSAGANLRVSHLGFYARTMASLLCHTTTLAQ